MPLRKVCSIHRAIRDDIRDLVTRSPLPRPGLAQIDPFLLLNHHGPQVYPPGNGGLPFGPHPHRGFETVTLILEGSLAHSDSGGHESIIHAGGAQWMTAGAGFVHAELSPEAFKRDGGALEILQLWVNLPARLKMTAPRYVGVQREDVPVILLDNDRAIVAIVAGELKGVHGPIPSLTGIFLSVVTIAQGGAIILPAPSGRSVFLYVVSGEVSVSGTNVGRWHLVDVTDGDRVELAAASPVRLLFGHGEPIGEPVIAHGPFVMTSTDEIAQAIRDYESGLFHCGIVADGGQDPR